MHAPRIYTFDNYHVDLGGRVLYRDGQPVHLAPKVFDTLVYLLERPNQIVIKEDLINAVWRSTVIEKGGVARNISALRAALQDSDKTANSRYIITVAKRGYKFCAVVNQMESIERSAAAVNKLGVSDVADDNVTPGVSVPAYPHWFRKLIAGDYPILVGLFAVILATAFVIPTQFNWSQFQRKQLTSNSPDLPIVAAAISPNGKTLAYTELNRLYIAPIGSAERTQLNTPPNTIPGSIDWFPDNRRLLISGIDPLHHRPIIWSMAVDSSEYHILETDASIARLSPDGLRIAYIRNSRQVWIANSDGSQAKKIADSPAHAQFFLLPQFSADGNYILTARKHDSKLQTTIEAQRLGTGTRIPLYESTNYVADFLLLASNDLFVSETAKRGSTIVSTAVDLQRGTHGSVHAVGDWPTGIVAHFSASQDGKRVTVINDQTQSDVYVANLQPNGTAMTNIRRLTMDDSSDRPAGWWNDSKSILFYSNRHDSFGIYKQSPEQANADTLISDGRDNTWPTLSPDGRWLLYFASNVSDSATDSPTSLMRKPMAGGPAELIDTKPDLYRSLRCGSIAKTCVLAEHTPTQAFYYEFDADKGRIRELAKTSWSPGNDFHDWDLSPDAKRIAYIDTKDGSTISIIDLSADQAVTQFKVPGFDHLSTLAWDAAGTGFYLSTHESASDTTPLLLMHAALDGHINVLRYQLNSTEGWAIPSPDGRLLAFQQWSADGNVWLLER